MRAVRSQQHGRAVCGQGVLGEKKVFSLVTFFAPAKKVTRDIQSRKLLLQSLKIKSWILADGMPSKKAQTLALPSNRPGNDRIRLSSAAGSLLSVDVG